MFADLRSVVPLKEIRELSTKHNIKYFETSALTMSGLKTCFDGAVSILNFNHFFPFPKGCIANVNKYVIFAELFSVTFKIHIKCRM